MAPGRGIYPAVTGPKFLAQTPLPSTLKRHGPAVRVVTADFHGLA